jgi:transglutaminase-like putative cysteine protease
LTQLQPYLCPYTINPDPVAVQLAQEISLEVEGNTLSFLSNLNQHIYLNCQYTTRHKGDAWAPAITWNRKEGSCRDLAVLFMDVCRAVGIATRFVSGYQEGDPDTEDYHLHGWVEAYIPGGGWRGYDPTHGLAVADRHISLVASAFPRYTIPVSGAISPVKSIIETNTPPQAQMEAKISMIKSDNGKA